MVQSPRRLSRPSPGLMLVRSRSQSRPQPRARPFATPRMVQRRQRMEEGRVPTEQPIQPPSPSPRQKRSKRSEARISSRIPQWGQPPIPSLIQRPPSLPPLYPSSTKTSAPLLLHKRSLFRTLERLPSRSPPSPSKPGHNSLSEVRLVAPL